MIVTVRDIRAIVHESLNDESSWFVEFMYRGKEMMLSNEIKRHEFERALVLNGVKFSDASTLSTTIFLMSGMSHVKFDDYVNSQIKKDLSQTVDLLRKKYTKRKTHKVPIRVSTKNNEAVTAFVRVFVEPDLTVKTIKDEALWVFDPETLEIDRVAEWDDIGIDQSGLSDTHIARLSDIESGNI